MVIFIFLSHPYSRGLFRRYRAYDLLILVSHQTEVASTNLGYATGHCGRQAVLLSTLCAARRSAHGWTSIVSFLCRNRRRMFPCPYISHRVWLQL
jgi:hypothetical protein